MEIEIRETSNTCQKKVVGTQITADLYEQLKADAEFEFMSISDLLRKIIYLYYRDKKNSNGCKNEREIR